MIIYLQLAFLIDVFDRMGSESAVLPIKTDLKNKLRGKRTLSLDDRVSTAEQPPANEPRSFSPFQRYEEEERFPFQRAANGFELPSAIAPRDSRIGAGGVQLLSQNLQAYNQLTSTSGIAMSRFAPIEEEDPLTKADKKRRLSQDTDTTDVCGFHIDPSDFPIDGNLDGPPTATPAMKKTRFDSSTSFNAGVSNHTHTSSSSSMLTPKCRDGTAPSPTMLSVAKVFHLLGDGIACGKIGKSFSIEQRKQFRESLSSSTSSKGMIAIAENVLTSMRFSGDDFNVEELNEETKENLMSGMLSGMLGGLANQQDGDTPTEAESLGHVSIPREAVVRMEI